MGIRDRVAYALRRRDGEGEAGAASPDPLAGLSKDDAAIAAVALPYTMTGVPRLQTTIDAVRYSVRRGIPGAFAECGVWRGGSILAMILTLQQMGEIDRDIYLYDTFEGMTEPTALDTSPVAPPALDTWTDAAKLDQRPWTNLFGADVFDEDTVKQTVLDTGYPSDRVHFVRGMVEETLPRAAPPRLALLRLDTDWYESTLHELNVLYPLLSAGGVLLIDDYGHWEGAKRAVDEYFAESAKPILLSRIDYSGRVGVKG